MNDTERGLFSDREAHQLWASQLLDLAGEKAAAHDAPAARELKRMAEVHQRQAEGRSL